MRVVCRAIAFVRLEYDGIEPECDLSPRARSSVRVRIDSTTEHTDVDDARGGRRGKRGRVDRPTERVDRVAVARATPGRGAGRRRWNQTETGDIQGGASR